MMRWIARLGAAGSVAVLAGCQSTPHAHLHVPPQATASVAVDHRAKAPQFVDALPEGFAGELLGLVSQAQPSASAGLEAFRASAAQLARKQGAAYVYVLPPEWIYAREPTGRAAYGDQLTLYRAALYSD
ncbi:MAG: hypothetical protein ACFB20_07520 [Opitutales bacterium]